MIIDRQIHSDELKLRILSTNQCNKNCSFCLNDFQYKWPIQFIDPDFVIMAILHYSKYFYGKYPLQVYFSGGEPTLHDGLFRMMAVAKQKKCRITLNTNGSFDLDVEREIKKHCDHVHLGVYEISKEMAIKAKRLHADIQGIYPFASDEFVKFYTDRRLRVKIFQDFKQDINTEYVNFASKMAKMYGNKVSFRHTGLQENRGGGCDGCKKKCITLKAVWLFPDSTTHPCPQVDKKDRVIISSWDKYFKFVEKFHTT